MKSKSILKNIIFLILEIKLIQSLYKETNKICFEQAGQIIKEANEKIYNKEEELEEFIKDKINEVYIDEEVECFEEDLCSEYLMEYILINKNYYLSNHHFYNTKNSWFKNILKYQIKHPLLKSVIIFNHYINDYCKMLLDVFEDEKISENYFLQKMPNLNFLDLKNEYKLNKNILYNYLFQQKIEFCKNILYKTNFGCNFLKNEENISCNFYVIPNICNEPNVFEIVNNEFLKTENHYKWEKSKIIEFKNDFYSLTYDEFNNYDENEKNKNLNYIFEEDDNYNEIYESDYKINDINNYKSKFKN